MSINSQALYEPNPPGRDPITCQKTSEKKLKLLRKMQNELGTCCYIKKYNRSFNLLTTNAPIL